MAAQKKKLVYRGTVQTTDATVSNTDFAIPTDTVCAYTLKVVLHETTSGNEEGGASFKEGFILNNSGTCTLTAISSATQFSAGLGACTVVVSASTSNFRLANTGIGATTINWQYELELFIN